MNSLYLGIDYHKNTCTLCFLNEEGQEIEISTKKTSNVVKYLANKSCLKIGVEASGGVNDFADKLKASGHEVTIINPKTFRLVGLGGKKTDKRDARVIAKGLRAGFAPIFQPSARGLTIARGINRRDRQPIRSVVVRSIAPPAFHRGPRCPGPFGRRNA